MIVTPKFKGYICTTAHPMGCAYNIKDQIEYVQNQASIQGPKNVLIIGASAGYGLASRIVSTFGANANTLAVIYDKPAFNIRTATAGWYNTAAFEKKASESGKYAKSVNGDAFLAKTKEETIQLIKKDLGKIDLVIYSIASPRRTDPVTGELYHSVLKPIGKAYASKTVDINNNTISDIEIAPASEDETQQTVKVMGGEDWILWIKSLYEADVLAPGAKTVTYTYYGSEITKPIYRNGTIGRAKEHLEQSAVKLNEYLKSINGRAYVSSNKALVTQSSSAIPVVTLYISLLSKIMKEKNIEETCIEQIYRLFSTHLYSVKNNEMNDTLIRMDDYELRADVQEEVKKIWSILTSENVTELTDIEGFKREFLKLFGFCHSEIDYTADVNINIEIPGINLIQ